MNTLETVRDNIDTIDDALLKLLQERVVLVKKIGEEKKRTNQPIRDYKREQEQLLRLEEEAERLHIPKVLITNIWKLFFEISEEIEK